MKKTTAFFCLGLTFFALSACDKEAPTHSVEYYKEHAAERKEMIEKCKADPDLSQREENCRSAADAEFRSGSFKQSTPSAW